MGALFHITTVKVVGLLMTIIGFSMRYYVNRQRFNRRGVGGLQQYKSYERAVVTTTFERIVKVIGTLLLLGGLFFIAVDWFNDRSIEKRQQEIQQQKNK